MPKVKDGNDQPSEAPGTEKESLALDIEALRRRLGPVKVRLIDQWIREVNGPLDAAIAGHLDDDAVLLDVGCSRGDPDLPSTQRARFSVGCDVDILGLRANTLAGARVLAPIEPAPFADGAFDVIVCKWVAEHLEDPAADFRECHRVLKPGGALVLLTPNANSLFVLASRLLPYRLKQVFKGKLFGVYTKDTFRTWYRANTRRRLEELMREAGLVRERTDLLAGAWTFFIFWAPLARAVRGLERVQMRIPLLRGSTAFLLGVWRKPG